MKNLIFIFLFITPPAFAQQKDVPFTLEDRDRIIRIEERLNSMNERINSTNERITSLEKQMDTKFEGVDIKFESMDSKFEGVDSRFESQQRQLDDLKNMFTWGFSILITLMLFILGYIIWDRRTAMHPMMERIANMEIKTVEVDRIKAALKEMGESDQKIAEILKRAAIF